MDFFLDSKVCHPFSTPGFYPWNPFPGTQTASWVARPGKWLKRGLGLGKFSLTLQSTSVEQNA